MCGRFVLESPVDVLAREFDLTRPSFDIKQSFNIAPGQSIHTLVYDGERRIHLCRWGYVPSWSKDPSIGNRMINARSETITEKKSFKNAFEKRRCLIPADGFFEWRVKEKAKSPFFIRLKSQKPFGLAGLYNNWTSPDGETICTCTIITTGSNELLQEIHHRMPAIIPRNIYDLWLDPAYSDTTELVSVLRPYPANEMELYEVSTRVNSPRNNSPENIQPLSG